MNDARGFSLLQARELAYRACLGAGASEATAASLAAATVSAEAQGKPAVGFTHLVDYLVSLRDGRIDGAAAPRMEFPAPALVSVDVCGGVAQAGFDIAIDEICARGERYGVVVLAVRGGYTTGELGYYGRRLAERGLLSLAFTNGPPLLAPPGASRAVYCTNPLAFVAPGQSGAALAIDQSSSATAFVNLRSAAERGETLPEGWAVDAAGAPTVDPTEALKGALLTFGGARGANIALLTEILAGGLAGANWSLDAPSFREGDRSPGAGLLIVAVAPRLLDPAFVSRLEAHLQTLERLGVYIPGRRRDEIRRIELPFQLLERIEAFAAMAP